MSGRLDLRRGVVVATDPLAVEIDGERRRAWADETLLGEMRKGDDVVVNCAALDLGLGSGGFDVVHLNLTRGLSGGQAGDAHVMKLNYSSLQHPVEPVEGAPDVDGPKTRHIGKFSAHQPRSLCSRCMGTWRPPPGRRPRRDRGIRVGYVQTAGGALPGSLSRDVAELHKRGLICGHITAAPTYGGEHEALSTVGALAAAEALGWDSILVGPGPGIIGSDTELGHGGMVALDSAHAALSLKLPTIISPRLSSADPRERHRGLSHHTATVLGLLLAPVTIAVPEGASEASSQLKAASANRHRLHPVPVDLDGYEASGLSTTTMGRQLPDDPLFFEAPLAAGTLLASPAGGAVGGTVPRKL